MSMEIQIAVAKINQYNSPESGDTLETVERPGGGISVVLADSQSSGKEAKQISTMVVRKAISLLAEGVREGASAQAASDYLYTEKKGGIAAFLNIMTVDFPTGTIILARNNPMPILIARRESVQVLHGSPEPIGTSPNIRPSISEIPIEPGMTVLMFTDGLMNAGNTNGMQMDVRTLLKSLLEEQDPTCQEIADTILADALSLDNNQPVDDISVVVLRVVSKERDLARRMTVHFPIPDFNQTREISFSD